MKKKQFSLLLLLFSRLGLSDPVEIGRVYYKQNNDVNSHQRRIQAYACTCMLYAVCFDLAFMLGQFPAAKDTEVCKFVYTYVYGLLYNAQKLYCYYIADYIMYVCIYLGLL